MYPVDEVSSIIYDKGISSWPFQDSDSPVLLMPGYAVSGLCFINSQMFCCLKNILTLWKLNQNIIAMKKSLKKLLVTFCVIFLTGGIVTTLYSLPYCKITCEACGNPNVKTHTHNSDGTVSYECELCFYVGIAPDPIIYPEKY